MFVILVKGTIEFSVSVAWVTTHFLWLLEKWLALNLAHDLMNSPIKDGVYPFKGLITKLPIIAIFFFLVLL